MKRLRLAGVFAHPDDDAYGLGGTMALERHGVDVSVVLATSGGAGEISDPSLATRDNLADVREREERAALAALGISDPDVHFLRYPDGDLKAVDRTELLDRMTEVLARIRPHVVVTFGPEGVTKHGDHITIGQVCTEAFHRARAEAGEAFDRLYYNAIPQSEIDRFWKSLRERGIDLGDPEGPFMPRGVPDETITVRVDCSSVMKAKFEGIRAHATHWQEFGTIPPEMQERLLSEEFFVQAWPPVTERQVIRSSSLFDGLR